MRFNCTLALILVSIVALPQPNQENWHKGELQLKNGRSLKGLIQYNDKHATIQFRESYSVPMKDAESFNEGSIAIMEFFNEGTKTNHRFYSLNVQIEDSGFQNWISGVELKSGARSNLKSGMTSGFQGEPLFEVIAEFSNGAILKRKTQEMLIDKDESFMNHVSKKGQVTAQYQGFFCMFEDGTIDWFLVHVFLEQDNLIFDQDRKKRRYKGEVIKKFLGAYWKQVDAYADENKLKFSREQDIAQLLAHYKQLLEGN